MNRSCEELEANGVLIAVRGDLVRIVSTDLEAHQAVMDGFVLHSLTDADRDVLLGLM